MPIVGLENIGQLSLENADMLDVATAYNKVGFFRRAIDIRRNGVSNMPYSLTLNDNEIVNEQTINTVEIPLVLDVFSLIPDWATDLDMYGAAYGILLTDDGLGVTGKGWTRIHPSRVTPFYNIHGEITHWQIRTFSVTMTVPVERLLYIWETNRITDRGHGEPIARAALTAASILSFSGTFQSSFFENGALNPTIVTIEGISNKPPKEQTRLRAMFNNLFGGLRNAHNIQIVDGQTTVNNLQQPLKDMALTELTKDQKEEVSTTLGVPLSLVMSNAANYATATQDDFNFYDKAIKPFVTDTIAKQLNNKLFKDTGYALHYQASRLDAFQAVELQKSVTLNGMLDRNVIDINEYRESMGLPPVEPTEEGEVQTDESDLPEIFGYHIDAGVVTQNEVRARLNLPPDENEAKNKELKNLTTQLSVMQAAVSAGIPPEQAAKMVGLAVDLPTQQSNEVVQEIKTWRKMAIKRYLEGNPTKALAFTTDIIPEPLCDKIKSALATVSTVDSVKTIFNDAVYHA